MTLSLDELRALEREHQVPAYARLPVAFTRGEGSRLWDTDGDEYLDLQTGLAVSSVGHCHPKVVEAIREQAGRLIHSGNLVYTEPALRLAERLSTSSLDGAVHFANSGTEAVEAALKMARKAKPGGDIDLRAARRSTAAPTGRCRRRRRRASRRRSRRSCPASARSPRRSARCATRSTRTPRR